MGPWPVSCIGHYPLNWQCRELGVARARWLIIRSCRSGKAAEPSESTKCEGHCRAKTHCRSMPTVWHESSESAMESQLPCRVARESLSDVKTEGGGLSTQVLEPGGQRDGFALIV